MLDLFAKRRAILGNAGIRTELGLMLISRKSEKTAAF